MTFTVTFTVTFTGAIAYIERMIPARGRRHHGRSSRRQGSRTRRSGGMHDCLMMAPGKEHNGGATIAPQKTNIVRVLPSAGTAAPR